MPETNQMMEEIGQLQQRLDELRAILRQRLVREDPPQGEIELFICRVRDERVGLPLERVDEVLPMCALTALPESPLWIPGILDLRGAAIPVIDVLARAERRKRETDLDDFIVICSSEGRRFGIVVQKVYRIATAPGSELQTVPQEVPLAPYVLGLFRLPAGTVFLLSLSALLATSDLSEDCV